MTAETAPQHDLAWALAELAACQTEITRLRVCLRESNDTALKLSSLNRGLREALDRARDRSCVVCGGPFTAAAWADRHDLEDGVCHEGCCPDCQEAS